MTLTMNPQTINDSDLRSDVEDELEWDPAVPTANVGVSVTDHAVTLSGTVHTFPQRLAAVRAARRVKGVHTIADEIVVVPAGGGGTTDQAITLAVERIIESLATVPADVRATVHNGLITLTGTVEYQYQKDAAYRAVRDVHGVTWVQNDIVVKSQAAGNVVRSKIVSALHRNADLDSKDIHVVASGHEVWLTGHTRSLAARTQAESAAWSSPGVEWVHNNIIIRS